MGGLIVGILWGLVVSVVVLAAASLSTPLPPRPEAPELEVSVGAEGAAPEAVTPEAEPGPDNDAAAVPETPAPAETPEPQDEMPVSGPEVAPAPEEEAPTPAEEDAAPVEEAEEEAAATPDQPAEDAAASASAPATGVPLPAGSEFNRPPPEQAAALPASDTAPNASVPAAPASGGLALSDAPSFDTAPGAQPNVNSAAPAGIGAAPSLGDAPAAPSVAGGVSASTAPGALTQPEASAAPQVDTAAIAVPDTAEAAPEPDEIAGLDASDPDTPDLPTPRFPTIGDGAAADAEEAGTQGNGIVQFPQTSRLPQAGGGASDEEEDEIAREIPEEEEIAPEDLPAIRAYAADFDATEARPLMAIVLIDDPDSPIEQATLTRFTFPVAFAVDPMQPDAAARARVYREAGFEVVMLGTMLPEGATAMDTEVAVIAAQAVLPETVALLDTPEGRIQGDRPVLDATVGLLAETGHGLVAFPRGLNAAEQTASRAGVPAATAFRLLDDEDQRATEITRYLARAAFAAGQDGTVIVAGRTRPDTVTALFSWALGDRSEAVALAPLSAVLLRAAED